MLHALLRWVHVGDYIYEYGSSTATDFSDRTWGYQANRWPSAELMDPQWEIVELNDYRRRYAVYHTDHGLQQLRARAPMIATWDDHEITNNWFFQGAQNHQSTCPEDATYCDEAEGSWVERINAGAKAYLEWLPIRRGTDDQSGLMNTDIKQVIEWGDLATIVSVDTRGFARSADYVGGWLKPGNPAAKSHYPDGNPNSAVSSHWGQGIGAYAHTMFDLAVDQQGTYTIDQYVTPGQEGYAKALEFKQQLTQVRDDPSRKKIGDYQMDFIMDKFAHSKAAGKTWQIFADATTEQAWSGPDLRKGALFLWAPTVFGCQNLAFDRGPLPSTLGHSWATQHRRSSAQCHTMRQQACRAHALSAMSFCVRTHSMLSRHLPPYTARPPRL